METFFYFFQRTNRQTDKRTNGQTKENYIIIFTNETYLFYSQAIARRATWLSHYLFLIKGLPLHPPSFQVKIGRALNPPPPSFTRATPLHTHLPFLFLALTTCNTQKQFIDWIGCLDIATKVSDRFVTYQQLLSTLKKTENKCEDLGKQFSHY